MTDPGPLTAADVGAVIRAYRKASGLSQKDLARLGGVSRATLNYLESGRDEVDIGAGRLFALLDALGVPVVLPGTLDRAADDEVLEQASRATGKGKKRLAVPTLMEALASGKVPQGAEAALGAFFDTASGRQALVAVRSAAVRSGNPPKEIWANARALAKALHCTRPEWGQGA